MLNEMYQFVFESFLSKLMHMTSVSVNANYVDEATRFMVMIFTRRKPKYILHCIIQSIMSELYIMYPVIFVQRSAAHTC